MGLVMGKALLSVPTLWLLIGIAFTLVGAILLLLPNDVKSG